MENVEGSSFSRYLTRTQKQLQFVHANAVTFVFPVVCVKHVSHDHKIKLLITCKRRRSIEQEKYVHALSLMTSLKM